MAESITAGVHHVGLTVDDVEVARDFFVDVLGFEVAGGRPSYPAVFVSDGSVMVTLWQAADPETAVAFDRRANIGLHHLALRTGDLDGAYERLRAADGVDIEFAPEPVGDRGARHLMCGIPGGIRLELIQP